MVLPDIIFLDVGGTLLFLARTVGETYSAAAARHGHATDPGEVDRAFRESFREMGAEAGAQDRGWWSELVHRTFAKVGVTGDLPALFDELHAFYAGTDPWRAAEGAREIGPALRERGYRTGILSNWDTRLPPLLEGMGLLDGMDPVVVSGVIGVEKPDPEIFRTALRRAGVAPERALMVGDDLEADYRGARSVGMQAILVPRDGEDPGVPFVRSLPELLDRLPPRDIEG